jgi:hypothetical protein
MEKIPGWVEKIFAPMVNELIGEVRGLNTKVDGLRNEMLARFEATDVKIDSLKNETKADIESLRKETKIHIETLEKVMISKFVAVDARFDSLEAKIPVVEKMAKFEVRRAELEKKVSVHA